MSPNPVYALCHDYAAGERSITNRTGYRNAELEPMLDGMFSIDSSKTDRLVGKAQELLAGQRAACPIACPPYSVAYREELRGYSFSPGFPIEYSRLS
jgi:hypothetical protein